MKPGKYHQIEHTADLGIEVVAPTLNLAFATAALAMFDLMGSPSTGGSELIECRIEANGIDRDDLLVDMLSELLVKLEMEGMFLREVDTCEVERRNDDDWRCTLVGKATRIDRTRERGLSEIKAVTYHDILVVVPAHTHDDTRLRVIFDV